MDVQHFATGAYIVLLCALVFFVAVAMFFIFRLKKELRRSIGREKERAAWSHAVLLAQEDERKRISRELHDTVAQDLRYLSLEMGRIGKTLEADERNKRCAEAAALLLDIIRRVRVTCANLVPPNFQLQGLPDALRNLCLDFGKRTGIECRTDIIDGSDPGSMDDKEQLQIFRIIQEALANVENHAKAGKVSVMFHRDAGGNVHAGVFDDGAGFDSQGFTHPGGAVYNVPMTMMGIRGMHERAAILNGSLEIASEPGEGTSLRLAIPPERNGAA